MSGTTGSELIDSLRGLRIIARELQDELQRAVPDPATRLTRLRAVVDSLGRPRAADSLRCPPEYLRWWIEFLEGKREQLDSRTVRYLCWEAEISTGETFQYYLNHHNVDLKSLALQGLVRSCHNRWSPKFAAGAIAGGIRDRLERYKGPNRLLAQWKANSRLILGPNGAEEFGVEIVQKRQPIKARCEFWGLTTETCAYVQCAVRHAAKICRESVDRVPELMGYLLTELLPWRGWTPDAFKDEISQVILHPATSQRDDFKESVIRFVLNHPRLRDPRPPHNKLNWAGMGEAERRVIGWLSRLDIVFFFESVLTEGKDRQGRKAFWLNYVPRLVGSRTLLSRDDRYRLDSVLRQRQRELANVGSINATPSAFLLDFGSVVAIEFSDVGACFLYRNSDVAKIVPDLWTSQPFNGAALKEPNLCLKRVVHRKSKGAWYGGGWEEEVRRILEQAGIRKGA